MSRKLTYFFKSTKDPQNLTHEEQSGDLNEVCPPSITENTINCDDIKDEIFQPTKTFTFPKTTFGKRERSCQPNWFEKFTWLHYDKRYDRHDTRDIINKLIFLYRVSQIDMKILIIIFITYPLYNFHS